MDLRSVMESLLDRPFTRWPAFACGAIDDRAGRVCGLDARWCKLPLEHATIAWTYCDRHRPADAEPITDATPYSVTRLELRVAVAGRPGELEASAVDALRLAVCALEDIGATVTGIRVVGGKASQNHVGAPLGRLQLAGRPKPVPRESSFTGPPETPPWWRWQRRRAAGE